MRHEIVPGRLAHIRPLTRRLRQAHGSTVSALGVEPRRALHDVVLSSHYCRTALVDGHPEAMWGIRGAILAETAYVWLVMSEDVTAKATTIVREARRELAIMARDYEELATTVLFEDEAALRLAVFLGFHDCDEDLALPRKERIIRLRENPRHKIAVADHFLCVLGWHGAA